METLVIFEAKKVEAHDILQKLKETNAKGIEIEKASVMFRFWEAMEQEAGEELGALLYEFAVLVDFDFKLLKPIAEKDAGFWSDIEGMGWLEFNLRRLELERSARQISLLQSIDIGIKALADTLNPNDLAKEQVLNTTEKNEFLKEYEKLPDEKEYNIPLEKGVTDQELKKMEEIAKRPLDIDALLKEQ